MNLSTDYSNKHRNVRRAREAAQLADAVAPEAEDRKIGPYEAEFNRLDAEQRALSDEIMVGKAVADIALKCVGRSERATEAGTDDDARVTLIVAAKRRADNDLAAARQRLAEIVHRVVLIAQLSVSDPEAVLYDATGGDLDLCVAACSAVGPVRFGDVVKIVKEAVEQVDFAYAEYGDPDSVQRDDVLRALRRTVATQILAAERDQTAFFSMVEPLVGNYVRLSGDDEMKKRAGEIYGETVTGDDGPRVVALE